MNEVAFKENWTLVFHRVCLLVFYCAKSGADTLGAASPLLIFKERTKEFGKHPKPDFTRNTFCVTSVIRAAIRRNVSSRLDLFLLLLLNQSVLP